MNGTNPYPILLLCVLALQLWWLWLCLSCRIVEFQCNASPEFQTCYFLSTSIVFCLQNKGKAKGKREARSCSIIQGGNDTTVETNVFGFSNNSSKFGILDLNKLETLLYCSNFLSMYFRHFVTTKSNTKFRLNPLRTIGTYMSQLAWNIYVALVPN